MEEREGRTGGSDFSSEVKGCPGGLEAETRDRPKVQHFFEVCFISEVDVTLLVYGSYLYKTTFELI